MIGAEGYVFELERRGYIKAGPYVPEVILDEPDALRQLHREFLRAGADVMVALTYYAHRKKLKDVGREGQLEELNRQAVRIANEIAAEGGALVAGNICNTWSYDPADPKRSGEVVREQYREQLGWAVEEGIDLVIAETNDFVGEALIGLEVCQEFGLPALVTFASVQPEKTYDDYPYVDACKVLADAGAAVVGLNCSRGPATMLPLLEQIRAAVDIPIAAQPVPYRTDAGRTGLRVADLPGRPARLPDRTRAVPAHPLRDGRLRPSGSRSRCRSTSGSAAAAHRTTCGPWPRPSAARHRQPLLAGAGPAPGARAPRRHLGAGSDGRLDRRRVTQRRTGIQAAGASASVIRPGRACAAATSASGAKNPIRKGKVHSVALAGAGGPGTIVAVDTKLPEGALPCPIGPVYGCARQLNRPRTKCSITIRAAAGPPAAIEPRPPALMAGARGVMAP